MGRWLSQSRTFSFKHQDLFELQGLCGNAEHGRTFVIPVLRSQRQEDSRGSLASQHGEVDGV